MDTNWIAKIRILLDSNAYLRLANSFHPLLHEGQVRAKMLKNGVVCDYQTMVRAKSEG
jgi:hypothetical protein